MTRDPERILDLLSAVSGIIAFVWIGLRADVKSFKEATDRISAAPRSWRAYWKLFLVAGPYFFFGLFLVAVTFFAFREPEIVVRHHVIKTIQSNKETVTINPVVEIASDQPQFEIAIAGAVYGPELQSIHRRFGEDHAVKVFAVVSEHSATEEKQGLVWVQYYQSGMLSPTGEYVVRAYLGGIGVDSAKDGDRFRVRIYIPVKESDVVRTPYESLDDLPKPLFLSDPIYIRCKRI
jgi:hypothetical protein